MADTSDKITLSKYAKGFIDPKNPLKASVYGFWLLVLALCGWALYVAYIKPHINPIKTQQQSIVAQKGSNITVVQKQEQVKKAWYVPSPFVEIYWFTQTNDQKGLGTKFGCRWEF